MELRNEFRYDSTAGCTNVTWIPLRDAVSQAELLQHRTSASVSMVTWLALAMRSTLLQLFCASCKRNLARQTIIHIRLFSEKLLIYSFRILAIVIEFQRRCLVERGGFEVYDILQIFGLNNLFLHKIKIQATYIQKKLDRVESFTQI